MSKSTLATAIVLPFVSTEGPSFSMSTSGNPEVSVSSVGSHVQDVRNASTEASTKLDRSSFSPSSSPLLYKLTLHPNDVLLGRGAPVFQYEGNVRFRKLIQKHKKAYNATDKNTYKNDIVSSVIATVRANDGQFVKAVRTSAEAAKLGIANFQHNETKAWTFADEATIVLKVKQTLREPDARYDQTATGLEYEYGNTTILSPPLVSSYATVAASDDAVKEAVEDTGNTAPANSFSGLVESTPEELYATMLMRQLQLQQSQQQLQLQQSQQQLYQFHEDQSLRFLQTAMATATTSFPPPTTATAAMALLSAGMNCHSGSNPSSANDSTIHDVDDSVRICRNIEALHRVKQHYQSSALSFSERNLVMNQLLIDRAVATASQAYATAKQQNQQRTSLGAFHLGGGGEAAVIGGWLAPSHPPHCSHALSFSNLSRSTRSTCVSTDENAVDNIGGFFSPLLQQQSLPLSPLINASFASTGIPAIRNSDNTTSNSRIGNNTEMAMTTHASLVQQQLSNSNNDVLARSLLDHEFSVVMDRLLQQMPSSSLLASSLAHTIAAGSSIASYDPNTTTYQHTTMNANNINVAAASSMLYDEFQQQQPQNR